MDAVTPPPQATARARRRRVMVVGLLALGLLALGGLGVAAWWWLRPPRPPDIPLDKLEADVASAIQAARERVVQAPRSALAWGTLAETLLANDVAMDECLVCLRQAERLEPNVPCWPYLQGGTLLNQGKREQALTKLQRAVDLCGVKGEENFTPRLFLAETLLTLDRSSEAESLVQQVLANDPRHVRAHFDSGILASARQDWKACRSHLEACLGNPQAQRKACTQLAAVCLRLGDKDSAAKYSDLEARLPPDLGWIDPYVTEYLQYAERKSARYRRVEQLEGAGRFPDAANELWRMAAKYPANDVPFMMLGRILPQMGDLTTAERMLRKARELAPEKFQVHYLLSLVFFRQGEELWAKDKAEARKRFEESVACARRALSINADFGFAHLAAGQSLKYLGRRAEALAALRKAVHCSPEHADMHLQLGLVLADEGDGKSARHHLEEALRLAPTDLRARAALDKLPPAAP